MKQIFLNKDVVTKLDDFVSYIDQTLISTEKTDENLTQNYHKLNSFSSAQISNLLGKIQLVSCKLENLQSTLKSQLVKCDPKSADGLSENYLDIKNFITEKKSSEGKVCKKKAPKAIIMTHMEIKKNYLSSILEIMNSVHFKIDHNVYRNLTINSFDFLPYISQKLTSSISSYKDVNLELLHFCWKLMSFPKSNITFSENQKLVGAPEILPLRYGNEGPLLKNSLKLNGKKNIMSKKGAFSFYEDAAHVETVRLLKKIYNTTVKQLQMFIKDQPKEEKQDDITIINVKDLYKECKNNLNTKIHMYKINFLSFLMLIYLENPKFEMQIFKAREIKSDYFERQLQFDHIKYWESKILSNI